MRNLFHASCFILLSAITVVGRGDETLSDDVNLAADTDWSSRGVITVPEGVTVNLNGHRLTVAGITGSGRIADFSGYDMLPGISSTSGGKQYIATGITPSTTTAIEHDFTCGDIAQTDSVFFGTGYQLNVWLLVGQGAPMRWYGSGNTIGNMTSFTRYVATVSTDKKVSATIKSTGAKLGTLTNQNLGNAKNTTLNLFNGGPMYGVYTLHKSRI